MHNTFDECRPNCDPPQHIFPRTEQFAVRIIRLSSALPHSIAGVAIARQIVRSGTSIGANIAEAQHGMSRKDFVHCMEVALKESRETLYWLRLIVTANLLLEERLHSLTAECEEIVKILVTIVRRTKNG